MNRGRTIVAVHLQGNVLLMCLPLPKSWRFGALARDCICEFALRLSVVLYEIPRELRGVGSRLASNATLEAVRRSALI